MIVGSVCAFSSCCGVAVLTFLGMSRQLPVTTALHPASGETPNFCQSPLFFCAQRLDHFTVRRQKPHLRPRKIPPWRDRRRKTDLFRPSLRLAYLILLLFLLCAIMALDKCIILRLGSSIYKLSLSLFALAAFGALILSSAGSERVSMFCLLILFPILSFVLEESFRQKTPMRITFIMLGFIPMFTFPVSVFISQ